jgi:2-(1,2-epoxy-1,2-dihydrophenyl)acetyl-CoA isomerase
MSEVIVERDDGIVRVTLNRPEKKNALTAVMMEDLAEAFDAVNRREEDRVLVLTGAGDGFCSGADLSGVSSGAQQEGGITMEGMRRAARCVLALHGLTKPTLAAVNGVAAGAGCNLALGCDLVIASDRARFSEIFVQRGLSIDFGGSWLLPRLVGLHHAKELAFLGEIIDAPAAAAVGLVNRVVAHAELESVVDDIARRLAALPPHALALNKQLLNQSSSLTMQQAVENEGASQTILLRSLDAREAVAAFFEKRPGNYTGR